MSASDLDSVKPLLRFTIYSISDRSSSFDRRLLFDMFILLALASSLAAESERKLVPLDLVTPCLSIELILAATMSKVVSCRWDCVATY
jgi:hypothetical protein